MIKFTTWRSREATLIFTCFHAINKKSMDQLGKTSYHPKPSYGIPGFPPRSFEWSCGAGCSRCFVFLFVFVKVGTLKKKQHYLGGGFKDFLFSPLFGEDVQFD